MSDGVWGRGKEPEDGVGDGDTADRRACMVNADRQVGGGGRGKTAGV